MATIKNRAIKILSSMGFAEVGPGKWGHAVCHDGTNKIFVYLGRGYSIRIGKNKLVSRPVDIDRLAGVLASYEKAEPLVKQVDRVAQLRKEMRRKLHDMISSMDAEECMVAIAAVSSLRGGRMVVDNLESSAGQKTR